MMRLEEKSWKNEIMMSSFDTMQQIVGGDETQRDISQFLNCLLVDNGRFKFNRCFCLGICVSVFF